MSRRVLALEVYVHRLARGDRADGGVARRARRLVFTGGIGEHLAAIRARAVDALGFLGVAIDPRRNESCAGDAEISADGAAVRTLVLAAHEDREMARQARALLGPR